MKYIIIAIITASLLSSCGLCRSKYDDINIEVLDFGLCQSETISRDEMDNSLTGNHKNEKLIEFIEHTDSIEALLNAQFAVRYMLKSTKRKNVLIDITWKLPKGTRDQQGDLMEKVGYQIKQPTNFGVWSSYTLDLPNEVQRGTWILIIKAGKKKLLEKNFYLY